MQKNYFRNLESLCDDIQNVWLSWILRGLLNVYNVSFYFMYQIRSFCVISIFTTNTKINFCILLFDKFYFFGKWNKSLFKILRKNYFLQFWVFMWWYTKWMHVFFYTDYLNVLVSHFILWIKFVHFVWFQYLKQIQKLIFVFYFSMNLMFLENE